MVGEKRRTESEAFEEGGEEDGHGDELHRDGQDLWNDNSRRT